MVMYNVYYQINTRVANNTENGCDFIHIVISCL